MITVTNKQFFQKLSGRFFKIDRHIWYLSQGFCFYVQLIVTLIFPYIKSFLQCSLLIPPETSQNQKLIIILSSYFQSSLCNCSNVTVAHTKKTPKKKEFLGTNFRNEAHFSNLRNLILPFGVKIPEINFSKISALKVSLLHI